MFLNKEEIRSIVREELSGAINSAIHSALNSVKSVDITADSIRNIIRDEVSNNNAVVRNIIKQRDEHDPFAVYMGEGTVLTKSHHNVLYMVNSFDTTFVPHLIVNGVYESELTNYLLNNIKSDSVFVDVGANFGYYSCLVAKRIDAGKGGKVYSFEANGSTFNFLERNIMINWIDRSAVSLHCIALSDEEGKVQFRSYKYQVGGSHIVESGEKGDGMNTSEVITVNTKKMDQILAPGTKVDFVKIDVEGAEFKVLKGAERTIKDNPGIKLLIEWNNSAFQGQGASSSEVAAFLKAKNLQPFTLDWRDGSASEVSYDFLVSTSDHFCAVLFKRPE